MIAGMEMQNLLGPGWNLEKKRVYYYGARLTGEAGNWFSQNVRSYLAGKQWTLERVVSALERTFLPKNLPRKIRREFNEWQQGPNELVFDALLRLHRLHERLREAVDPYTFRCILVSGLRSEIASRLHRRGKD